MLLIPFRNGNSEAEDLWDFGTVRHGARTIGRSSIKVSGPPLTWEKNDLPRNRGSDGSDESVQLRRGHVSSVSPSITTKGDLPSIPSSPSKSRFEQDTLKDASVRNIPNNYEQPIATDYAIPKGSHKSVQRESSDHYGNNYTDLTKTGVIQHKMTEMHIEEDDTDTTMLDSVILPAIASVSICHSPLPASDTGNSYFHESLPKKLGLPSALCSVRLLKPSASFQVSPWSSSTK